MKHYEHLVDVDRVLGTPVTVDRWIWKLARREVLPRSDVIYCKDDGVGLMESSPVCTGQTSICSANTSKVKLVDMKAIITEGVQPVPEQD